MTIKIILFDFDGTIADTHQMSIDIANQMAQEFHYNPISQKDFEELKNLSSRDVLLSSGVSPLKVPFLLRRFMQELGKHVQDLRPIQGIPNCLRYLKEDGYSLGIISSNLKDNMVAFLANNHLDDYIDFIYSSPSLFGKHRIINKVMREKQVRPSEVVYIGDETRDINSAKKSKIKVIAVGWGFNSPKILEQYEPDFLIFNPEELPKLIRNIT